MNGSASSFYVTGGTLRHDAPCYIERQADRQLLDGLLHGEFCHVLTARQMGKSSLMVRTAVRLREEGCAVVVLDLTAVGQNLTVEQWYHGLIERLEHQLDLEEALEQFLRQNRRLSPVQRFFGAIGQVVLPNKRGPVVVFIDEIDTVRSLPFSTDEFFAAIRECHNRRTEAPEFNRVSFCLLGVATPSDLIRETRITPFNIGRRIELHDFTPDEAAPLTRGLQVGERCSESEASELLRRVLYWTGGHPYLTQRLCQALVGQAGSDPAVRSGLNLAESASRRGGHGPVDRLCADLFFSDRARERDDNLVFVRERLLRAGVDRAGLLHLYEQVQRGRAVRDDETDPLVSVLRLAGVVRLQDGRLLVRNRIYRRVFDRAWVRAHMPDAEVQRQRTAYYRGVIRTAGIAVLVVAVMALVVLMAVEHADRRRALALSCFSEAQARRVSGLAGQRDESLQALREARRAFPDETALREEVIACLALTDLKRVTNRIDLGEPAGVSELNPDRGLLAAAGADGTISLRGLADGQTRQTLAGVGMPVKRLCFSPQANLLLAEYEAASSSRILVWDWQVGQPQFTIEHGIHARAVDFSPQGGKLAVGLADGQVLVHALPDGRRLCRLELKLPSGLPRAPHVVRFDPTGERLAESCLASQQVQIWDLRPEASHVPVQLYHADVVQDIAWHPNGERLATAGADASVHLWDAGGATKPVKLIGHEGPVTAVAFSPHGELLASLAGDETLRLWIPATGRHLALRLTAEPFDRVRFAAGGRRLIAGRAGGNAGVWEVLGGEYQALPARIGKADRLRMIRFSVDGRWLAASSGEFATLWDSGSGMESGKIQFTHNAAGAWFSADGQHLLASTTYGLFSFPLRDLSGGPPGRLRTGAAERLAQAGEELGAVSVSPDGRLTAVAHKNEVLLLTLQAGQVASPTALPVGVHYHRLALHPHGSWLAARVQDSPQIHLWHLQEGIRRGSVPVTLAGSAFFDFSLDGKWLMACRTGRFEFYRVGAWSKPEFAIPQKQASDQHAPVAGNHDGTLVALAVSRYTIQLFRIPDESRPGPPRPIGMLTAPDRSPLELLTFSPDGRRLAAVTQDQVVHLWDLARLRVALAEMGLAQDWPDYP